MIVSEMTTTMNNAITFGCDRLGRLESVMVHTPGEELKLINESNREKWLFDAIPEIDRYREEHLHYCDMLQKLGVKVFEIADVVPEQRESIRMMPNLTFLHDTAVISKKGMLLSRMAFEGRKNEDVVVKKALARLGIPILTEFDEDEDAFEGCLLLSESTLLVAHTERHRKHSIQKFIRRSLAHFDEVIFADIPKARRYMHPDTIFNRIKDNVVLAYPPAFIETYHITSDHMIPIDLPSFLAKRGIEMIAVSDKEQQNLACSFVPLQSGVMLHYDTALEKETIDKLKAKGVEILFFHPDAMRAGGGSLRCHTLRLCRK